MTTANTSTANQSQTVQCVGIISDSLAFGVAFSIALTIIQRAVGFVRGILFCRYMTDQELGQWSMAFSFLMLLAPLALLGLPGSFGRFVEHYLQKGQIGTFVRRITQISSVLTIALATSMYLAPEWYSQIIFRSSTNLNLIHCMAFALVMVAGSNFLISLIESLRQVRLVSLMRFVQGVSFALLGVAMLATWQDSANAAVFAFGIACLITCLPAGWFLWQHRTALEDRDATLSHREMWLRIAPFAIWLWATNLVWNLFEVGDRYMLIHWSECSAELAQGLVGQYHSARVVPMLLVSIAVVLEGMILPYMTALWEQNKPKEAGKQIAFAFKTISLCFTFASICVLIGSPILFDTMLGGKYDDGLEVLGITLVFSVWFSLFMFAQIYLWVAEKGKYLFILTAAGLGMNLALNAALIPIFGLWGAVLATTSATLLCLTATLAANNWFGNHIHGSLWLTSALPLVILLPIPAAIVAMLGVIVVAACSNWIFNHEEKQIAALQIAKIKAKLFGGTA